MTYDATKEPRTGRPVLPQDASRISTGNLPSWEEAKSDRRLQEHHESGIPPYDIHGKPAADETTSSDPAPNSFRLNGGGEEFTTFLVEVPF